MHGIDGNATVVDMVLLAFSQSAVVLKKVACLFHLSINPSFLSGVEMKLYRQIWILIHWWCLRIKTRYPKWTWQMFIIKFLCTKSCSFGLRWRHLTVRNCYSLVGRKSPQLYFGYLLMRACGKRCTIYYVICTDSIIHRGQFAFQRI